MGRDASHVTLEVALQTNPTLALISEEESWHRRSLSDVVEHITHVMRARVREGNDHGVILVPEGLLERLSDMRALIAALNSVWTRHRDAMMRRSLARRRIFIGRHVDTRNRARFLSLPIRFQELLSLDRDAHGNITLSQIPTEELLIDLVRARIEQDIPGYTLKAERHFYGYEGRCGTPTAFDQRLAYQLGVIAASLVLDGRTGYLAALGGDLRGGGTPYAVPLAPLLEAESREGHEELVVRKRLVEHDDPAFLALLPGRVGRTDTDMQCPGPYQDGKVIIPVSIALNNAGGRL
jgi:pyrophosphate--fructose-6-phosphate 1-phosphotransferase